MILLGSNIAVDFFYSLASEILGNKAPEIHLEIVLNKLQRSKVILHHQVRILSDNVDLLDLLLVKLVQHPIIVYLVLDAVVCNKALDFHSIVGY